MSRRTHIASTWRCRSANPMSSAKRSSKRAARTCRRRICSRRPGITITRSSGEEPPELLCGLGGLCVERDLMSDDPEDKRPHRLEDHLFGMDPMHSHEEEADHDHDHDDVGGESDPTTSSLWLQDNITLLSVGIDIGSAGTQVIFSRVHLRRLSEELTSRYFVIDREIVYQSPVA